MQLVDDAKRAWKWISVQAMAWAIALQGAWEFVPDDLKAGIPPKLVTWITVGLLVLGIAGRLVKQGAPNQGDGHLDLIKKTLVSEFPKEKP